MRRLILPLVLALGCESVEVDGEEVVVEETETAAVDEEAETETGFEAVLPTDELVDPAGPQEVGTTWIRKYDVPVTETVHQCIVNRDGSQGPCYDFTMVRTHHITCTRACNPPFTVVCWDATASASTTQPASTYLVGEGTLTCL